MKNSIKTLFFFKVVYSTVHTVYSLLPLFSRCMVLFAVLQDVYMCYKYLSLVGKISQAQCAAS